MAEQILMGRFDYPSPYWDSVGDPALDLVDRMLTVDPEKRITVDGCLEHPWLTGREIAQETQVSIDSTEGLTGAMANMDFSERKTHRERTLLSTLNEVHVTRIVEMKQDENGHTTQPRVKIFDKNHGQPSITDSQQQAFDVGTEERMNHENVLKEKERKPTKSKGKPTRKKVMKERAPDAERTPVDFMAMGGKGDQPLFDD